MNRTQFVEKIGPCVFTCTFNGVIRKYKTKEYTINGPNSLTAIYESKCSIITMKIIENGYKP